MEKEEKLRKLILENAQKGNVTVLTCEGLMTAKLEDIVKQPLEGLLYDINRDRVTITTFLEDPKWINDFALTQILEYFYNKCNGN